MRYLPLIAISLALAGCYATAPNWKKEGATQAEFDKDKIACLYEAKKATGSIAIGSGDVMLNAINAGMNEREIAELCMKTKGYTPHYGR